MSRFASITDIRAASGLRMACLRGVPSPWTEAAKGIFRIKGLDCQYGAQSEDEPDNAIAGWAGNSSVPVVALNDEPLRTGWAEILLMAERIAPDTPLLPSDFAARAEAMGLAHEICGEMGLGWSSRNLLVRNGMADGPKAGFHPKIAQYLARKYGYFEDQDYASRMRTILTGLSERIAGCDFLLGDRLTAVDIYWATFSNLVRPMDEERLPMNPHMRVSWSAVPDDVTSAASDELMAHRDRVYAEYLELPVPL